MTVIDLRRYANAHPRIVAPTHHCATRTVGTDGYIGSYLASYLRHPSVVPETRDISFSVADGVVTLVGTAKRRSDVERANRFASRVAGVHMVEDRLDYEYDDIGEAGANDR